MFMLCAVAAFSAALSGACAQSSAEQELPRFSATPTPSVYSAQYSMDALSIRSVTIWDDSSSAIVYYPFFSIPAVDDIILNRILAGMQIPSRSVDAAPAFNPTESAAAKAIEFNLRFEGNPEGKLIVNLTFFERSGYSDDTQFLPFRTVRLDLSAGILISDSQQEAAQPIEPQTAATIAPTAEPRASGANVAITFDDGPSIYTSSLLGVLRANGARATFCVLGNRVSKNKKVVKQAVDQGCEVIGHSWDHASLIKLSEGEIYDELLKTRNAIESVTGVRTRLYRPPYGSTNELVRSVSKNLDMSMVLWSIDTEDWLYKDSDRLYNYILDNVKDGAIILCHDIHQSTVEAMKRIIPELVRRGYNLITISELMDFDNAEPVAGKVYYRK
ncbi:MAG: polysaccharide deacetylase family protein [Oscillospiraceae bacterium]|nr:polysaccharide deacetylase family protein [Oscillospiraceae bacterium]